jgi:hypothetical protein
MILAKRFLILVFVGLLVLQGVALYGYFRDQHGLNVLASQIASPQMPPSQQGKKILEFLRKIPNTDENEGYFLLPPFRVLRATAREVADQGGDCADRSRLLVTLLHLRGIRASKWSLYTPSGVPKHAVVEAEVETGKMVFDPLFGLWFPRPGGGYYGIAELRANPQILPQRVAELISRGERPGADGLEGYPLNQYYYGNARTINWDKSLLMRTMYRGLHSLIGDRANYIPRTYLAEQPALMIVASAGAFQCGILIVWLLVSRAGKRGDDF